MPDDLIGSAQAVAVLGIDKSTLSRWVSAGRITPVGRIGKAFVFSRADVEKLREQLAAAAMEQLRQDFDQVGAKP